MKVLDSAFKERVIKSEQCEIGTFHFSDNILIIEFSEGINVNFKASKEFFPLIISFYKNKPFGIISNRVNSYSLVPMDSIKFKDVFTSLTGYAVVSYDKAGLMNAQIENSFCADNNIIFEDLMSAIKWIDHRIKSRKSVISKSF